MIGTEQDSALSIRLEGIQGMPFQSLSVVVSVKMIVHHVITEVVAKATRTELPSVAQMVFSNPASHSTNPPTILQTQIFRP